MTEIVHGPKEAASDATDVGATYDVIVVGLGCFGSATAYQLASAGLTVLGLEQFGLGHDRGASHETTRMIRRSYHRPEYVSLVDQAYEEWSRLEEVSGERLVTTTGGLDFFPADSAVSIDTYTGSLADCGLTFEVLDGSELQARWPNISVDESTVGVYEKTAGILAASQGLATMQWLAHAAGATLVDETPVIELREAGQSVTVVTPHREFSASAVVLCADAWLPKLVAPFGWSPQLTVLDQQMTYFEVGEPDAYSPDRYPVWNWLDDPCFYGFPSYGAATVKAGDDCKGPAADPDGRTPGTDQEALDRLSQFMSRTFPASGRAIRSVRCLYTLTADRDFVLGTVPGSQRVHVALGSAHGFKFSPVVGRLMAAMAAGRHDPDADWAALFAPDRAAVNDPDFEAAWII